MGGPDPTGYAWGKYWSNGAEEIADSLKPPRGKSGPVLDLSEMTEDQIREIESKYNAQVIRPKRKAQQRKRSEK